MLIKSDGRKLYLISLITPQGKKILIWIILHTFTMKERGDRMTRLIWSSGFLNFWNGYSLMSMCTFGCMQDNLIWANCVVEIITLGMLIKLFPNAV